MITYYLEIDTFDIESGMSAISFVDKPAIRTTWQAFEDLPKTSTWDDSRQIIMSPVAIPEVPIKRMYGDYEYFVKFSASTIEKMMKKYIMDGNMHKVNLQHDESKEVTGVYMVESFIVDERFNVNTYELPKGTWMVSYYIEDKELYKKLVEDPNFNGLSLEGHFNHELSEERLVFSILHETDLSDDDKYEQILNILKD